MGNLWYYCFTFLKESEGCRVLSPVCSTYFISSKKKKKKGVGGEVHRVQEKVNLGIVFFL